MRVRAEGPQLISELVRKNLNIDCSVLMGANIAKVGCSCLPIM
jgi:glycerol-3-phosphate dehydrogenase (NAD+)